MPAFTFLRAFVSRNSGKLNVTRCRGGALTPSRADRNEFKVCFGVHAAEGQPKRPS